MKRLLTTLLLSLTLLFSVALWSAQPGRPAQAAMQATYPLNPSSFTSLGVSPFASAGTYTINASKNNAAPVLTRPDNTTINGVFFNSSGGEIAVFTFDSINIPADVTVQGLRNANSRPVAMLSQSSITIAGVVDVSGGTVSGALNGGAAGPGGAGGGGAGGDGGTGGAGGIGFVNGNPGGANNAGGGGSVIAGGGGGGGVMGMNERGAFATGGGGGGFGGAGLAFTFSGTVIPGGIAYGNLATTLQGGSGGGGAASINNALRQSAQGGGGGGGAVELGAIGGVTITGSLRATGGHSVTGPGNFPPLEAGGGAGGGIVIHGAAVDFSSAQEVSARGGGGNSGGGGGRVHVVGGTINEGCVNLSGGYPVGGNGVYTFSGTRVFQLNFDQQPPMGNPDFPLSPVVKVSVRNGCGPITDSLASITLALGNNPTGATLGGTLTKQVVNGVATFDDLTINKNGTGYTLIASSSGLSNLTSDPFNVVCQTVSLPQFLIDATVGSTYNGGVVALPFSDTYLYELTMGTLPGGLTLDSSSGRFLGVPTISGTFSFTIKATHGSGCSGSQAYQLTVYCLPFTIGEPTATGALNMSYNSSAAASPAASSGFKYQYSLANGTSLPGGLSLNSTTGAITGSPTVGGNFSFAIKADLLTNGNVSTGCSDTQTFNLNVSCPSFTVGTPTDTGTVGANYSSSVAASPAAPAGFSYQYSLANGASLPGGLSLNPTTGAITGTPAVSGSFSFSIKAELFNASNVATGCSLTQTRSINVTCPSFTVGAPSASTPLGSSYSSSAAASPAAPAGFSYQYTLANGQLPNGLTLEASTGAITGTPTVLGNFSFDLKAELFNSGNVSTGCSNTQTRAINVTCPSFTVGTPAAAATVGVSYNSSVAASPATPAGYGYRYSLANGSTLPGGLTLDATTGAITGIPTVSGAFSFGIKAELFNSGGTTTGCSNTQTRGINVDCPSFIAGTPTAAALNVSYSSSVAATPAAPSGFSYRYSLANGSTLPGGLTLDANTGAITGTPTVNGTFGFDVRVELLGPGNSPTGCGVTQLRSIAVTCPTISLGTVSGTGTVGVAYNQTVGVPPTGALSFMVTSGALPTGLMLNAGTGAITGSPTQAGGFNFTVTASVGQCSASRNYAVTIGCSAITLAALGNATVGVNYTGSVSASPSGTYNYSLLAGSLPTGLTLNTATGAVTGAPTSAGTYGFTIKAQAANGCAGQQSYSLIVGCPSITLSALTMPTLNTLYRQAVTASPAGGGYSYAVTSGALPAGLSLNPATGSVSGTPTTAGAYSFTITATGFGGCTGSRSYSDTIAGSGGCPTITLPDLPGGQPGQLYNSAATASPSGTYSYAVTAGSLPGGLTLYGNIGLIFGYPTQAGSYSFTITATGSSNCTGSKAYSVQIGGAASQSLVFGDFDGDGKADLSVWRGLAGDWLTVASGSGQLKAETWGSSAAPYFDVMTPGDYDGDGKMDLAVFRRGIQQGQGGQWLIKGSKDGAVTAKVWGAGTDIPVPGDYDGDGKTDLAVWRGAESNWYILRSSDGQTQTLFWGTSNAPYRDLPVAADYDGDGKTDIAVFRQQNGHWYIKLSSDGSTVDKAWGLGTDAPVVADYDGDGKADIAVWRGAETNWYILRSSDGAVQSLSWGTSSLGDVPVPGDYDGDGKADVAVWRASDGNWYAKLSRDNSALARIHGQSGDLPALAKSRP